MASVKKRLKNIEGVLARFAAGEKRLVDLIVGLVVENLERRLSHRMEAMAAEIHDRVVEDIARLFPEREDVEELVERAVDRALQRHLEAQRADELRAMERRVAERLGELAPGEG